RHDDRPRDPQTQRRPAAREPGGKPRTVMNLTQELVDIALWGAEWVLWLLLVLSVLSIGVMIERGLFLRQRRLDLAALEAAAIEGVRAGLPGALDERFGDSPAMAARVA